MSLLVGKERLCSADAEENNSGTDVGIRHTTGQEGEEVSDKT